MMRLRMDLWWNVRLLPALALCLTTSAGYAATSYATADKSFGFDYPQMWKVEEDGSKLHIVSQDGARFLLQRDLLTSLPAGPPAYDKDLRATAAQLITPVMKDAEFVRGQTALVDHGSGAVFRFQSNSKPDTATGSVWIAIIGKHSVVIVPEKANQAGEAIGLSTIVQSAVFADSLPRAPIARPGGPAMSNSPGSPGAVGGVTTVSFKNDIMPILSDRCVACHNAGTASGGLNASTFATFTQGGQHAAMIVPGKPEASRLLDYLTGKRALMPKGSDPLKPEQIALISKWISEGAQNGEPGSRFQPGSATTAASTQPAGPRVKRPGRRAAMAGSGLMEAYTGHLSANDSKFTIDLMHDGTATADWTSLSGSFAHFTGTYTGQNGEYTVVLNRQSGDNPKGTRVLHLTMAPRGDVEAGRFTADDLPTRYDIAGLTLSEFGGTFSNRVPAGRRTGTKKGQ